MFSTKKTFFAMQNIDNMIFFCPSFTLEHTLKAPFDISGFNGNDFAVVYFKTEYNL